MTLNLNYIWVNTFLIAVNYIFRLREKNEDELKEEEKDQELKEINETNDEEANQ